MSMCADKKARFLITCAVMTATVMQVLDTTIVNVALPDMQGTFSATPDQISWVLTSYLVASAIFMPLTGYFSDNFGRKKYLLISIFGFTITSALCGISLNLNQIVFFRLLQGICGAALVPLSQAILIDTYPSNERGKAMAIWGIGVMLGPVLGPTLGGYLTEIFSWRWTFYVNVPVGILSLWMTWKAVPDSQKRERKLDWLSLICIVTAIGATQYILDRGNNDDWFESTKLSILACFAAAGLLSYIGLSVFRTTIKPVFNVKLFKDRNFVAACTLISSMGLGLFGSMVVQALMMQNVFNYPTFTTGLLMAPRGIASMFAMVFVGKYTTRISARTFIAVGIGLNIIASYMTTQYSLEISPIWIIIPGLIQGLGIGFVMIPLSTLALSTLPPPLIAEGAGLYSLMRTFGFSVGISAVATILARHTQIAWNHLGGFIHPFNPAVFSYLQNLDLTLTDPKAAALLALELSKQASMIAILDVFIMITWSFVLMLPLIFLLKSSPSTTPTTHASME